MVSVPNPGRSISSRHVFLSYSHDSFEHSERVLNLANQLRREGLDAILDQYEPHPAEGWPRWMQHQIDSADFVVLVCTASYRRRFEGETFESGKGIRWESLLTIQDLYDNSTLNRRIIPVLFEGEPMDSIPRPLRAYTRYLMPKQYEDLYRRFTNQPLVTKPPLGKIRRMPVKNP